MYSQWATQQMLSHRMVHADHELTHIALTPSGQEEWLRGYSEEMQSFSKL